MVVYIVTRHDGTVHWIKSMLADDVLVLPHLERLCGEVHGNK